jgi:hypothetical protein
LQLLASTGSANLADPLNMYHLKPAAIRTGDILLTRRRRSGSSAGDTTPIVRIDVRDRDGKLLVTTINGEEPPHQPQWKEPFFSRQRFLAKETGGPGISDDNVPYWLLGGGLRRFRVVKPDGANWTNSVMDADLSNRIADTDQAGITGRIAEFDALLADYTPEEALDGFAQVVNAARRHLREMPSSCAARADRERAFEGLYEAGKQQNLPWEEIDRRYRLLEDYVFQSLEETQSKTCCWDSSTPEMAQIILENAAREQEEAGMCIPPTVFRAEAGDYARWKSYAATTGRAAQWRDWYQDEPCPQGRRTQDDVLVPMIGVAPFCQLNP